MVGSELKFFFFFWLSTVRRWRIIVLLLVKCPDVSVQVKILYNILCAVKNRIIGLAKPNSMHFLLEGVQGNTTDYARW